MGPTIAAAMLAASVASAQAPLPVTIFIGPLAREGFVDADKRVLDSVKDLQKELRKHRGFAVAAAEADASLKLYVMARSTPATGGSVEIGTATGTATGTAAGSTAQGTGMSVTTPTVVYRLETLLRVGTYERTFTGDSYLTWKGCAGSVVKELTAWVAANRESLLRSVVPHVSDQRAATEESTPIFLRGQTLLAWCEQWGNAGRPTTEAAMCAAYVQGAADAAEFYDSLLGLAGQGRVSCPPEGVTYEQLLRVVRKFLQDHPERLHENRTGLVVAALRTAFPCPGQTPQAPPPTP